MGSPSSSSPIAGAGAGNKITSFSYFKKTIYLYDWWLINAGKDATEKKIGVSGFTSPESGYVKLTAEETGLERQPVRRRFSSAPILKIYDLFTLETTDGICVILNGFINKTHTLQNGFQPEVLNHFLIGFPPEWDKFAESCLGEALPRANEDERRKDKEQGVALAMGFLPDVASTKNDSNNAVEMQTTISKEATISSTTLLGRG